MWTILVLSVFVQDLFENENDTSNNILFIIKLNFTNIEKKKFLDKIRFSYKRDPHFIEAYKLFEVQGEIDTVLAKASVGWPLSRLGKSELSIMRVAAYEILYDEEVPAKVAINEAVELAKTYGNDSAPSFINGVLAKLVTEGE